MDTYMELIYCQIVDKLGNRLGYSFFSGRCIRRSTIEVFFSIAPSTCCVETYTMSM